MKRGYFYIVLYIFNIAKKNKIPLKSTILMWAIVKIVTPFPMIVFPAMIIDELLEKTQIKNIVILICIMALVQIILGIIDKLLAKKSAVQHSYLRNVLNEKLSEVMMGGEFESLENSNYIKKVERATSAVSGNLSWSVLKGISGPKGVEAISIGFMNIFAGIVQICSFIYILSELHYGIVILIVFSVGINSYLVVRKKRIDFSQREKTSEMSTRMNTCHRTMEDVEMAKDIRVYDMISFLKESYQKNREGYFKIRQNFFPVFVSIESGSLLMEAVQNIIIYCYLALKVLKEQITIGVFSRYFSTITYFVKSLAQIIDSIININLFGAYMEEYCDIVSGKTMPEESDSRMPDELKPHHENREHTITFENVWFQYPGSDDYALKNINLTIKGNSKILLVGLNGAGKSTLVKLMLRLYKPTIGKILIDGEDISSMNLESYLTEFSAVFQDYRIYAESLKENVMFDKENMGRFERVVHDLQIDHILRDNAIQYEDVLSKEFAQSGRELSQGQKQKIVLARALFKKSKVLILDEPTAALDAYAEYQIYNEFSKITKNRTVIYISHRLSAAMVCDRIIVIKDGEISEQGSHEELMSNGADYYRMFNQQAKNYQ